MTPLIQIITSVQDYAWELMVTGQKTIDFRRRWLQEPCIAYVYRSKTQKAIAARMQLGAPIRGTPAELGRMAEQMMAGHGAFIEDYFTPTGGGFAVPIEAFETFEPIPLADLRAAGFSPPQHFTYLDRYPAVAQLLASRIRAA